MNDRDHETDAVTDVDASLDDHGRLIGLAFRTVLRRDPDDDGARTYEAALRAGMTAADLLDDLARSEEFAMIGQAPPAADIAAPSKDHGRLIGLAFRTVLRRDPDDDGVRIYEAALRAGMTAADLLDDLARSEEFAMIGRSPQAADIAALSGDHSRLIGLAFRTVLRRDPDDDGVRIYEAALRAGMTAADLLDDLARSEEFAMIGRSPQAADIAALSGDHGRLIGLAFRTVLRRDPDDDGVRTYEAALRAGMTAADLLDDLARSEEFAMIGQPPPAADIAAPSEDHGRLIGLAFRTVLRRDPDDDGVRIYEAALRAGMTAADLLDDLARSEEFAMIGQPPPPAAAAVPPALPPVAYHRRDDYDYALTLLEGRLRDKGCRLQLGGLMAGEIDQQVLLPRMKSLIRTLAVLDML